MDSTLKAGPILPYPKTYTQVLMLFQRCQKLLYFSEYRPVSFHRARVSDIFSDQSLPDVLQGLF
jgi:hypothetical protein